MKFNTIKISSEEVAKRFGRVTILKHCLEGYSGNVKEKILNDFKSLNFLESYFEYYLPYMDMNAYPEKDFCLIQKSEDINPFLERFYQGESEACSYINNEVQQIYFTRCIFKEILKVSEEMIKELKEKDRSFFKSKATKEKVSKLNIKIARLKDFIKDSEFFYQEEIIKYYREYDQFSHIMFDRKKECLRVKIYAFLEKYPMFDDKIKYHSIPSYEVEIALPALLNDNIYRLELSNGITNIYKGDIRAHKIELEDGIYYPNGYIFLGHSFIDTKFSEAYINDEEIIELNNKELLAYDYLPKDLTSFIDRRLSILLTENKLKELGFDTLYKEKIKINKDFDKGWKAIEEIYHKDKEHIEQQMKLDLFNNNMRFQEIIEKL